MENLKKILTQSPLRPIVHVDDDPVTLKLVSVSYKKSNLQNPYIPFQLAKDCLRHMQEVKLGAELMPAVILVDINMPEMNGFEMISKLKKDPFFQCVPICKLLTSSELEEDREMAKKLGVDAYLVKPNTPRGYVELFNSWCNS